MTVEAITRAAAPPLDEWWDLWERDASATPFQSPAWLVPWRRHFREGDDVVLTLRRGGRLVGLLPLFRIHGRLLPWGAGTTDWLDGLFDPGVSSAEVSCALAALGPEGPVDLPQLRDGSPLLAAPPPPGWTDEVGEGEPCPTLALPATLPAKIAGNLRYYGRRSERAGIEGPVRAGPEVLDDLLRLHSARWSAREEAGVLGDPDVQAWHREALPLLHRAGMLRLYASRLGGRTVAALYATAAKGQVHYYIGGFDPDLETLGPGTVLIGHAIAEATREGARTFDFLRGREGYKYRWGATDRPAHVRVLRPPGS